MVARIANAEKCACVGERMLFSILSNRLEA